MQWSGDGLSQVDFMQKDECILLDMNDNVIGTESSLPAPRLRAAPVLDLRCASCFLARLVRAACERSPACAAKASCPCARRVSPQRRFINAGVSGAHTARCVPSAPCWHGAH